MLSLMLCNIKVLTMICDDLCSFLILIWETHTTFTTTCFSLLDVAHWWQEVDFGNKTVAAGELSRVLTRTRGAAMVRKGVLEITQFQNVLVGICWERYLAEIYVHICTHTITNTDICTHTHKCMYIYISLLSITLHTHAHIHTHIIKLYIYIHTCMFKLQFLVFEHTNFKKISG